MIDVTCALIIQNRKILVAQNSPESDQAGKWEFPGGKIQSGESAEECIVREINEELELIVTVIKKLQEVIYNYGHKTIRLIPFVCEIQSGTIHLNDHQTVKWVEVEELNCIDFAEADMALLKITKNISILKEYLWK